MIKILKNILELMLSNSKDKDTILEQYKIADSRVQFIAPKLFTIH